MKTLLIAAGAALTLVAALILYVVFLTDEAPKLTKPLAELVPAEVPGWASKDLPLAETESMNAVVNQILQFDQSLYREYAHGNTRVIVYVAYWSPGKVTTTDAGVHNPDSCWVGSGWTRLERKYGVTGMLGSHKLKPFEYGVYQKEKYILPVIFWHLVGGEPNRYAEQKEGWRDGLMGRVDRFPLYWGDIKKNGLNLRREQLFIRITANKSFDVLFRDPDFARLTEALAPLGIFEENKTVSESVEKSEN